MDVILKTWKGINWDNLQGRVDGEISAIGQRQDEAEEGKRKLLDESNRYRTTTDKEQRKVAVPLIKAFQKEVDQLTVRGKVTETALIEICAQLTNLPDPTPILEQAIVWKNQADRTITAIEEADQLRLSIKELHAEFSDLTNQDVTIRKLRETIKQLEADKTAEVEESIGQTERELREEFAIQQSDMSLRNDKLKQENGMLEKKVSELEARMRDAQRRIDTARLAADQKESLEAEQVDILSRDLDDAHKRVATYEAEVRRLSAELAESRASSKRGGLEDIAALGGLMKEKDEQIARLSEENRNLRATATAEAEKTKKKIAELQAYVDQHADTIKKLEEKLADHSDYEAIKKELRLLREIEFGDAASSNEDSINRLGETVQSLDRLLAEKNRRLQGDNAQLRIANERYQGDDVMQAILAGSHQTVVDTVSKNVGQEMAENYADPEVDWALDKQIRRAAKITISQTVAERRMSEDENDHQNLFKILMNMGSPIARLDSPNDVPPSTSNDDNGDIPFDQFRYSPKLTNYTGEPAKTPQEMRNIQDLQMRVVNNVRTLGNRSLNTSEIARQCKRLMVAYNIGQRLFAKYVMNQVVKSQGSLSELLSKPRHWSKLTDKGREAFRRIYAWISDGVAIDLLCSLSPRRVWPSEVRIEHPTPESLWESNSGSLPPPEDPDENNFRRVASAREDQYRLAGTNQAANAGTTTRNSRWRHDDIPKEKIMSIFQTELAKLREQETSLERAIANRAYGNGHLDELSSPYHEMSHSERMASINHAHQVMSARMRTGLSPITPDQCEMFGHIDTEDVVKQIKEFLSMNSISQRQFGEHVLGLSQGSVSDLLARPKQWSMLTQKGREPFIRMKLFMREVAQTADRARREREKHGDDDEEDRITQQPSTSANSLQRQHSATSTTNGNGHKENSTEPFVIKREPSDEDEMILPRSEFDTLSQSIEEWSDECNEEEIDTAALVRKVKDRLHLNGISQRHFGEVVLGLSAGGCSEILLRPRAWSSLSSRSREPFEKMKAWLNDKNAIQKLTGKEKLDNAYIPTDKVVINENGKRILSSDPPYDPSSDTVPPRKVQVRGRCSERTVITDQQKEALRFVFQHEHHPSQKTVELLSLKLNLNIRTVNNWFHNHRTRQKASIKEGKVFIPSQANVPRSKNWQQDLATLLEAVSQQSLIDESLPTMVPVAAPSIISVEEREKADKKSSQLDKVISRIKLMEASKNE